MFKKALFGLILLVLAAAVYLWAPDLEPNQVDAQYALPTSRFASLPDGTRMHYLDSAGAQATATQSARPQGAAAESAEDLAQVGSAAASRAPERRSELAAASSRRTIVLVHGSFDSAFTWELVIPELSDDFRVLAPDLPAHGLTGAIPRDSYSIDDMVAVLHAWTRELGLERFTLAGNSMGGNVAWRYALEHPDRVERLVLIDAAGYPTQSEPLVESEPSALLSFVYRNIDPSRLVRAGLERSVADTSSISESDVERSVAFLRRAGSREAQRIRNSQRALNSQPIERVSEVRTPTLIIWGALDALLPAEHAERFHEALPNSNLRIYTGIGHLPQREAPDRVADDIRDFVTR